MLLIMLCCLLIHEFVVYFLELRYIAKNGMVLAWVIIVKNNVILSINVFFEKKTIKTAMFSDRWLRLASAGWPSHQNKMPQESRGMSYGSTLDNSLTYHRVIYRHPEGERYNWLLISITLLPNLRGLITITRIEIKSDKQSLMSCQIISETARTGGRGAGGDKDKDNHTTTMAMAHGGGRQKQIINQ